jgi:hypothetical protein
MLTSVPGARCLPGAGVCEITCPALTVPDEACSTVPTKQL